MSKGRLKFHNLKNRITRHLKKTISAEIKVFCQNRTDDKSEFHKA